MARTCHYGHFLNKCDILEIASFSTKNGIRMKNLTIHFLLLPRSMGGAHLILLHCTPTRPPLYIEQVRTSEVQFKFKESPF